MLSLCLKHHGFCEYDDGIDDGADEADDKFAGADDKSASDSPVSCTRNRDWK